MQVNASEQADTLGSNSKKNGSSKKKKKKEKGAYLYTVRTCKYIDLCMHVIDMDIKI